VFAEVLHPLFFTEIHGGLRIVNMAFLPLMLTSVVCAAQLMLAWAVSLYILLFADQEA
jgi:hypothetical protein